MLAAAVKELISNETITEAPKACEDTDVIWESGTFITIISPFNVEQVSHQMASLYAFAGRKIFQYLKTRKIRGETGQVAFDDNGDRIYAEYDVINIREKQHKKIVGKYFYDNVSTFIPNQC